MENEYAEAMLIQKFEVKADGKFFVWFAKRRDVLVLGFPLLRT
jgi:hypothetical protein